MGGGLAVVEGAGADAAVPLAATAGVARHPGAAAAAVEALSEALGGGIGVGVREGRHRLDVPVHGDGDVGGAAVEEVGRGPVVLGRSGDARGGRGHVARRTGWILGLDGGVVVDVSSVFVLHVHGDVHSSIGRRAAVVLVGGGGGARLVVALALVSLDLASEERTDQTLVRPIRSLPQAKLAATLVVAEQLARLVAAGVGTREVGPGRALLYVQ